MEAAGCAAAAVSLSQLCVTAVLRLQTLHTKYHSARQTITALHTEVTVIGALMTYIKLIFDKNPDLEKSRFYGNPELGQILAHGLTGCQLVLNCLQEEVSAIMEALGEDDSKGRKGKIKYLWKEEVMKDLLLTVRGQHSAIASIIQCLQVENITELGTKVDNLRTVLSENQRGVQQTVSRSPSMAGTSCQHRISRKPCPTENTRRPKPANKTQAPFKTEHKGSVESSYRQYQESIPALSRRSSLQHPKLARARVEADAHAHIPGLAYSISAPAPLEATKLSRAEDDAWERASLRSGISVSSLTERWLESQLSPEETRRTLSRMKYVESCAGEEYEALAMRAPDTETFLENVQHFMPCIPESDTDDSLSQCEEEIQTGGVSSPPSNSTDQEAIWSRPGSDDDTLPSLKSGTMATPEIADEWKFQEDSANGISVEPALPPKSSTASEILEQSFCVAILPPALEPRTGCAPTFVTAATPAEDQQRGAEARLKERPGVAYDDVESKRVAQPVLDEDSKPKLPTIPSIYTERHIWDCDGTPSPPDPDRDGRLGSIFNGTMSLVEESGSSTRGSVHSLPPISVYSFVA